MNAKQTDPNVLECNTVSVYSARGEKVDEVSLFNAKELVRAGICYNVTTGDIVYFGRKQKGGI